MWDCTCSRSETANPFPARAARGIREGPQRSNPCDLGWRALSNWHSCDAGSPTRARRGATKQGQMCN
eukprot:8526909-Alexandrium_andersonii.AAC.1